MTMVMDPDCFSGKHTNCDGSGWETELDCSAPCTCACHSKNRREAARDWKAAGYVDDGVLAHLRDVDNRDDDMRPHEFVGTVDMIVGYLDGPLRRDLSSELEDGASLDEAIAAVRSGNLEVANVITSSMSVTLSRYPVTLRASRAAQGPS